MRGHRAAVRGLSLAAAVLLALGAAAGCSSGPEPGRLSSHPPSGAASSGGGTQETASTSASPTGATAAPSKKTTKKPDKTTAPSTTTAAPPSTTTATSRKTVQAMAPQPETPVAAVRGVTGPLDATCLLMEDGSVYDWLGNAVQTDSAGRLYTLPRQIYERLADFRVVPQEGAPSMYMLLSEEGVLSVSGWLPGDTHVEKNISPEAVAAFAASHGRQQESPQRLMDNVAALADGAFLTKDGDVYLYGMSADRTSVSYAEPVKALSGITAIQGSLGRLYALTAEGELVVLGKQDSYDIPDADELLFDWKKPAIIAEKVRAFFCKGEQRCYISEEGVLYIWGVYGDRKIGKPVAVAEKVANAAACESGYAYLTEEGVLYMAENGTDGVRVAPEVTDFLYDGALLYRNRRKELYGYGPGDNGLRGCGEVENLPEKSNLILREMEAYAAGDGCVFATDAKGRLYTWGNNVIGLQAVEPVTNSPLEPAILEPFLLVPLS